MAPSSGAQGLTSLKTAAQLPHRTWVLGPLFHVCAQPGNEFVESELVGPVKVGHKKVGLFGVRREVQAVDGKKRIRGGESRPLVAIDKGLILSQALPKRGGFLDEIGVIASLRPIQRGFQ